MNRQEFCKIVADIRKQSSIKMKDICFALKVMPTTIYRIEAGENNFNINFMMSYLSVLKTRLTIFTDKETVVLKDYDQIIQWIVQKRKGAFTQRQLAKILNVTYPTIANIERKTTFMGVDLFLKIIDILGYTIKIENNN